MTLFTSKFVSGLCTALHPLGDGGRGDAECPGHAQPRQVGQGGAGPGQVGGASLQQRAQQPRRTVLGGRARGQLVQHLETTVNI